MIVTETNGEFVLVPDTDKEQEVLQQASKHSHCSIEFTTSGCLLTNHSNLSTPDPNMVSSE